MKLREVDIDVETGLVAQARQQPSPNCDARPLDGAPELIVIHSISLPPGKFGGGYIDALFTNSLDPDEHPYFAAIQTLKVSSHFLIRRNGELVQYVPLNQRAWHAGQSSYEGRERCNDFSIGIELEGQDDVPYDERQYVNLVKVVQALIASYPGLSSDRIAGHSDIAPGRKTDPGEAFDWDRLVQALT